MKGTLTSLGDDRWRLRVYVGRRDGRPVQASRTFHGKRRAAETALARMVADITARENPHPETITVAALLDRWLDRLECTPYTRRGYRYAIDSALKPALGRRRISTVTPRVLDDTYHAWLQDGATPATVRKRHTILAACFHQAVKWQLIGSSPTAHASPPRASRRQLERVIGVDELRALVRAAEEENPMLGCAVALAALTGVRRGELCALRWSHFDLEAATMTVELSLTVLNGKVTEGDTKTHQRRLVALDPVAVAVVERRQAYQRELADWDGGGLVADPWLLSRRADGGVPCLPGGLSHDFTRAAKRLGLPYHLHELRHFAASMMLAGGVDPKTAATRLGHSRVTMTLDVYAQGVKGADRRAAELLGGLLTERTNVLDRQ